MDGGICTLTNKPCPYAKAYTKCKDMHCDIYDNRDKPKED